MRYLVAFGSTHRALKAEDALKKAALEFKLLPAPKEITAHCALVIAVEGDEALARALDLLKSAGATHSAIYAKADDADGREGRYVEM